MAKAPGKCTDYASTLHQLYSFTDTPMSETAWWCASGAQLGGGRGGTHPSAFFPQTKSMSQRRNLEGSARLFFHVVWATKST